MIGFFLRGIAIGLIFGVPAGAIGALTVQHTLEGGFRSGFVTGLGSSAADMLYACVGVFGITVLSDLLTRYQNVIGTAGGLAVIALGTAILLKKKTQAVEEKSAGKTIEYFVSSFWIACMNPATLLSFFVAFTLFNITGKQPAVYGIPLIAGIFIGTCIWWASLSGIVAVFRNRVTGRIYRWLNRILGCLMIVSGTVVLVRLLVTGGTKS